MPVNKTVPEVAKTPVTQGTSSGIKQAELSVAAKVSRPIVDSIKQTVPEKAQPADKSRYFKYPEPQKAVQ